MVPVHKESLAFYLTSITMETFANIKSKYEFLSRLSGKPVSQEIMWGIRDLSHRFSILQFAIFDGEPYENKFSSFTMAEDYVKILEHFDRYGAVNMNHDPTDLRSELVPMQSDIIEFVALRYMSRWFDKYSGERPELNKKSYTIDEAANVTGYKKSYLYKLKSEGKLKAQSAKGAKLFFAHKDIEKLINTVPDIDLGDII